MIDFVLSVLGGVIIPLLLITGFAFLCTGLARLPLLVQKVCWYFREIQRNYKYTFMSEVSTTEGFILTGEKLHHYRQLRRLFFRIARIEKRIQEIEISVNDRLHHVQKCTGLAAYWNSIRYYQVLDNLAQNLIRHNRLVDDYNGLMEASEFVFSAPGYVPDGELPLPYELLSYQDTVTNQAVLRRRGSKT